MPSRRLTLTLALLAAAGALLLAWVKKDPPALIIVCEKGGVHHVESHLASGFNCVLHDREGSAASAGALSVYDDSTTAP